jgi:hypothetical protein
MLLVELRYLAEELESVLGSIEVVEVKERKEARGYQRASSLLVIM